MQMQYLQLNRMTSHAVQMHRTHVTFAVDSNLFKPYGSFHMLCTTFYYYHKKNVQSPLNKNPSFLQTGRSDECYSGVEKGSGRETSLQTGERL